MNNTDKNIVINNYVSNILNCVVNLQSILNTLGDNDTINHGAIVSADILITTLNSEIVVLQNSLDNYG